MKMPTKQSIALNELNANMAALGCAAYLELLESLSAAIGPLQTMHQRAVDALEPTVQQILRSGSRDTKLIEHTLDQLLNHACMPKGFALFKALCRHYWQLDTQATASYINAYREMWDSEDKNDTEEVEP